MANPIVRVNVSQQTAPIPDTLQERGAFVSQGGSNLAAGTISSPLTSLAAFKAILAAPLTLASLSQSAGVATATLASTTASSGTYNATTGLVTLTLVANVGLLPGSTVTVSAATGTGVFADINGTYVATVGTGGTTLTYTIAASLTMTITGASVQADIGATNGDTFWTTIAGASPAAYDGVVLATVASASTFTFAIASGTSSPATGSITFSPRNSGELLQMATTFFAQGGAVAVSVIELGQGEPAAGPPALATYIEAQVVQPFYAYLVPRNWDGISAFLSLIASFEAPTAKTYFFVTTTINTYSVYTDLMKCVFLQVEAPSIPDSEFTLAADFYVLLNSFPSGASKVSPFEYNFVFGVTPYPQTSNATLLQNLAAANVSYIGTGAEGGISDAIIFGGNTADGNPVNYWYSVDWVQVVGNEALANAVINGSNNKQNPLYFNQQGINALQSVLAGVMSRGSTFGLVLNPVFQTQLDPSDFQAALEAGTYDEFSVVNAIPFVDYVDENPGDYAIGRYAGLSVAFVPLRGFDMIIFNLLASNFPQ